MLVWFLPCFYSTLSLTLVREQHFIRIIYYYYYYYDDDDDDDDDMHKTKSSLLGHSLYSVY